MSPRLRAWTRPVEKLPTSTAALGAMQSLEHAGHHSGDGWAASWVNGDALPCQVREDEKRRHRDVTLQEGKLRSSVCCTAVSRHCTVCCFYKRVSRGWLTCLGEGVHVCQGVVFVQKDGAKEVCE